MADTPGVVPDDPALVRPYVRVTDGVAARERGPGEEETWPEAASMPPEPSPADDDTAVQPVVPAEPAPGAPGLGAPGLGVGSRMLILAGGIALALAIVGFVLLGSEPEQPQPPTALPALLPAVPAGPSAGGSPRPSIAASSKPSPSTSPSAGSAGPSASSPSAAPPSSAGPSAPTLAPPPGADRTGPVTSAGGRCLALGGLFGADGSPIQVYDCMDINAQEFTLAADGTLRVSGKCARSTDDANVRVAGCDDAAAGQWRGGPGGTLVNSASGQCLTDPGQAGATVRVTACGGADQRWTLP
jgi:hypothetical protein